MVLNYQCDSDCGLNSWLIFRAKNDKIIGSRRTDWTNCNKYGHKLQEVVSSVLLIFFISSRPSSLSLNMKKNVLAFIYNGRIFYYGWRIQVCRAAGSEHLERKEAHPKLKVQWNRVLLGSCFCVLPYCTGNCIGNMLAIWTTWIGTVAQGAHKDEKR